MTEEEKKYVRGVVADEGLAYAVETFSDFSEIKDAEFHRRRLALLIAIQEFKEYTAPLGS